MTDGNNVSFEFCILSSNLPQKDTHARRTEVARQTRVHGEIQPHFWGEGDIHCPDWGGGHMGTFVQTHGAVPATVNATVCQPTTHLQTLQSNPLLPSLGPGPPNSAGRHLVPSSACRHTLAREILSRAPLRTA